MGRGKFKGKPTGRRMFSTQEEMSLSARPRTFKKEELKDKEQDRSDEELEQDSDHDQDQDHQKEEEAKKQKGVQGIIDIENPNLVKPKSVLKARNIDTKKTTTTTTELSRRERQEIEKQKSHERYMKLQEQGKTDQAKKDLERLALIRQQRAEAAKKRQEEKSSKC
ncbi:28 kDa heat- and acid-stable phosphoprotein-like isoform X2 [Impatiens glandulifera]|uniref:28 kDa heat- and acid-stable phosphoprotein-like isoform X2 n=1 Tax=Impatiens glandulifera TaxID=253017 RepID=UPI001FB08158|nr:28 kDa heat- and acid-stable phosphoprotein-like isoform X2 [Impatiens glandulifera]